jgi:hypothetical protein
MRINATKMSTPIEEKIDQKLKVSTHMYSYVFAGLREGLRVTFLLVGLA